MLPREKLQQTGPKELEDHELLALLLSRGNKNENVFAMAKRLLHGFDREELFCATDAKEFAQTLKIGPAQAAQLMACIELGKRFFRERITRKCLQKVEDVFELVRSMQFLKKEYVRGLFLNSRYCVIHDEIISIGSLDANILHPREIFRPAIECGAFAIVLVHNHPSGNPSPSQGDIITTEKLSKTADLLQIPLLDHIIVGDNEFFSFQREKLMTKA